MFVSAEAAPFSTVGGLSQVAYFLPRTLNRLGAQVAIFTPKYGTISEEKYPTKLAVKGLKIPTDEPEGGSAPKELVCNVKSFGEHLKAEPTVYFLENMEYYENRSNVYGYSDDPVRFALLSRGALEFIKSGYFVPDVIHINDWHTGYLADYLRRNYKDDPVLKKIATVFSIHNLYQGVFDFTHCSELDFDDGRSGLSSFFSERFPKQNGLKRGVIYSDVINTVSETYSREIMREEYGQGLEKLFKELRGKLYGVLNGLDYHDFNPATDKILKRNYSVGNIEARAENKADLQREFCLKVDPNVPLLAISGRMDWQKGLDLVMDTINFVLDEFPVQLVVLGGGDDRYRNFFAQLEKQYPGRVGTHLQPNFALPHKIFAGADMVLLPSRYEPGGIVAMESQHYGAVPVVRATGGQADSVIDFDAVRNIGTGFTFQNFAKESFLVAVVRALETYKNQKVWKEIVKRAMTQDFSWANVAGKYTELYKRAIEFHKEQMQPNPPMAFRQPVV